MERVVRHFQEELETLRARLLAMGGLAEERVRLAVQGLVDRDVGAGVRRPHTGGGRRGRAVIGIVDSDVRVGGDVASRDTPGLVRITAGNYGGRLGKTFIYLRPKQSPPPPHAVNFAPARAT